MLAILFFLKKSDSQMFPFSPFSLWELLSVSMTQFPLFIEIQLIHNVLISGV